MLLRDTRQESTMSPPHALRQLHSYGLYSYQFTEPQDEIYTHDQRAVMNCIAAQTSTAKGLHA